ncbi:Nif3-like dinuclear metal center hexameric protein [Rhizobacter sp. J219]|jgi:dinuclear metal center YbgI/SA1388 family protein|uniref:Nif3-like dinuclear metal center hexameric protein n=1 Tax=Rhizobacter sp. J219 TaxID=2898430 RepID=UPI0021512639|nr:Nif3-like dinuclear metal center hexameric protein [Rhizobacter sp. J219]MCR5883579.1 Nif3-like dinuclear metal center hexameric protein [Rhizobacter sp. J219]
MASRSDIESYLGALLDVGKFRDYGPNGLQIEGKPEVKKLVSGVTASRALIEAAIEQQADAILVHHGLFWRGHDGRLTGWLKARVELLMRHGINLYAYHLPLDAHPDYGNNAQLGARLKLVPDGRFGEQDIGFVGTPVQPLTTAALKAMLAERLGREPVMVDGRPGVTLKRIAWCTGGAQGYFESAIAAGAEAFITGEISEPQAHLARETGVAFFACGHHATERYGAPALGAHVAERFGLEHQFIEIDNPA